MRLYRPTIPLEVRCRVLIRQLGDFWVDEALKENHGRLGLFYVELYGRLTALLGDVRLELHHRPALVNRQKTVRDGQTTYLPDANDPEFLVYLPQQEHDIETRVRGIGAQLSDLAVARKRKRKERKAKRTKRRWPSRPLKSASRWPKRSFKRGKRGEHELPGRLPPRPRRTGHAFVAPRA